MKLSKLLVKTILFFILILVGNKNLFAQNFEWAKTIGGTFSECYGTSITFDLLGNVYVSGSFDNTVDFDPGAGIYNLTDVNFSGSDIFIAKYDHLGNFIWAKQMAGSGNVDVSLSIAVDVYGNVYTTGFFNSTVDFDPGIGTFFLTAYGPLNPDNIFVSKLDSSGNFKWANQIGGSPNEHGNSISLDSLGNVYVTGYFVLTADFDPGAGTYNLTAVGSGDIFISKFDSSGNFVWAKQMGGIGIDYGNSIATDASGNSYATGQFEGTGDFDPGVGIFNLTTSGDTDIFISKLDPSGNFIWAKQMGGSDIQIGNSICLDSYGNSYLTGYFNGTADFDPGPNLFNLTSTGFRDIFITKLDSSGNFIWAKQMGGTMREKGISLSLDASNNIYSTGHFSGTVDFDPGLGTYYLTNPGTHDFTYISKLDSSGNFIWAKALGYSSTFHSWSLKSDSFGNIFLTGSYSDYADFDPGAGVHYLASLGYTDMFVLKLSSVTSSIYEDKSESRINYFPNPTSGKLTLDLEKNFTRVQVFVKNLLGQQIFSENYFLTSRIDLDLKDATAGIYFIEMKMNDEKPVMRKVIKE